MLMPIQFEGVQSIMASIRAKALDTINNESPAPMPMHTAQGKPKAQLQSTKGKPGKEWLGDASKGQHATTYSKLAYYSIQLVRRPSCAVPPWQRGSTRNHTHRSSPHELPRSPGTQGEDFLSSSVLRALGYYLVAVGQKPYDYSGTMMQDTHFKREPRKSNCKTSKMNSAWQ